MKKLALIVAALMLALVLSGGRTMLRAVRPGIVNDPPTDARGRIATSPLAPRNDGRTAVRVTHGAAAGLFLRRQAARIEAVTPLTGGSFADAQDDSERDAQDDSEGDAQDDGEGDAQDDGDGGRIATGPEAPRNDGEAEDEYISVQPLQVRVPLGQMTITGYDICLACCGKTDGITASGAVAEVGRTCAAPPSLPFGTVLYIEGLGERVVEDRGGDIKNARLDVLCEDHAACRAITGTYDVYMIVGETDCHVGASASSQ